MRGAIPPLPQHVFMVWCSVKKSTETTLRFTFLPFCLAINYAALSEQYADGKSGGQNLETGSTV
jgi:hypothetical protein